MRPGQIWCWKRTAERAPLYYLVLKQHALGRWQIQWLHDHEDTLDIIIDDDQVKADGDKLIQDVGDL